MERICSQFQIGSSGLKSYQGAVVVDPENIYMLIAMNLNFVALGALGGLVGGAIAGAFAQAAGTTGSQEFETTYGQLPDSIRQLRAWGRVANGRNRSGTRGYWAVGG